jgi:hypothetical protein
LKLGSLWKAWLLLDDAQTSCELLDLLDAFHDFGCSEEKDRLFALVGLATDARTTLNRGSKSRKMSIDTDYSLSMDEIYHTFALQRMQSGRVFSTLADAAERRMLYSQQNLLPSWVPDLNQAKRRASNMTDARSVVGVYSRPEDGTLLLNTAIHYVWDESSRVNDLPTRASIYVKDLGPIGISEITSQSMIPWIRSGFAYVLRSLLELAVPTSNRMIMAALCRVLVGQTDALAFFNLRMMAKHR